MQVLSWRLRAALQSRRVVFVSGLAAGCILNGFIAPALSRIRISFDGEDISVYRTYVPVAAEVEQERGVVEDVDLARLSEEELAQLDVIEREGADVDRLPGTLQAPAKRVKKEAAMPRVAEASAAPAPEAVVMTAAERRLDGARRAYISTYSEVAVQAGRKYGVRPSFLLAQGMLLSQLANHRAVKAGTNNHFKIRCTSKKCSEGHCWWDDDDEVSHKTFFTRYKSVLDCYMAQAKALGREGYASSPELDRVIAIYSLQNLDDK